MASVRQLTPEDLAAPRPIYAVWELTLRCDQACHHCGSRAGSVRPGEIEGPRLFEVAAALANLGCREVVFIGGEAYLHPDLPALVGFLSGRGVRTCMQTGGRGVTPELARRLHEAGLQGLGVSVDGPARVHDRLRGNLGSHAAALAALDAGRAAGLTVTANTQINRLNMAHLRATASAVRSRGAVAWQVQLTVPMGRAADHPEWIVQPFEVVPILDELADIQLEAAAEAGAGRGVFDVFCGNNLGYYGPHEVILRSRPGGEEAHWDGCKAGIFSIGIESDGTIKGCPSLPTAPYAGGNVNDVSLEHIWQHAEALRFARERTREELWGHCASCYYADDCRAGCSWTAHTTLGRRGNYPFCYYRVKELEKRGVRERIVPVAAPPGEPFDFGRFELVEGPLAGAAGDSRRFA